MIFLLTLEGEAGSGCQTQFQAKVGAADTRPQPRPQGREAQAVKFGLATQEEIDRLPGEIRAISAHGEHCLHSPTVTAACTRV